MTLGDWLHQWMTLYVLPSERAPNSKRNYAASVRRISAAIGGESLEGLTALPLQAYLVEAAKTFPRAAQLDRAALSVALALARKLGLTDCVIDRDTLPMPPHKPRKAAVLDHQQALLYLKGVQSLENEGFPLALLLFGLRRGEALGVWMSDIDRAKHTICVQRQKCSDGSFAPLKTSHSRRVLSLPSWVFDLLPSKIGNVPASDLSHTGLYRLHRQIIRAQGLPPVTPHGLRHTYAVLALHAGANLKDVQLYLGHSKIGITADLYADHVGDSVAPPPALYL